MPVEEDSDAVPILPTVKENVALIEESKRRQASMTPSTGKKMLGHIGTVLLTFATLIRYEIVCILSEYGLFLRSTREIDSTKLILLLLVSLHCT